MTDVELDGRRMRREQNREAVLEALVELYAEGTYEPSAVVIAERAGISARSLFRYFDDADDLNRAAIERALRAAAPLVDPGVTPATPTAKKVSAVAAARIRLHDAIAPAARAARVSAHRVPIVAAQIHESRTFLRRQLRMLFAPELAGDRAVLLPALDSLCSFETYDLLRGEHRMSRPQAEAALVAALSALINPDGGQP
jgi:AcrR family transcriptional regulator